MSLKMSCIRHRLALGAIAVLAIHGMAVAEEARPPHVPMLPKYQQECAACHVAYPPGLLPAASWQRIMNGLPKHFGTDASLDAASVKELSAWLNASAGTRTRAQEEPLQDRITRSSWFVREHREVSASTWKLAAVKSASNCVACHAQANQGDFNEHSVRIPR